MCCMGITSKLTKLMQGSRQEHDVIMALTFDPKILRISFFLLNLYMWMKYDVSSLKPIDLIYCDATTSKYRLNLSVSPWPFGPQIYRYLPFFVYHLCMNYQVCRLETIWIIMLQQRQNMLMTQYDLDLRPFDPKSIGVFLSLSDICESFLSYHLTAKCGWTDRTTDRWTKWLL